MSGERFVMYYGLHCDHCLEALVTEVLPRLQQLRAEKLSPRVHLAELNVSGPYTAAYFLSLAPRLAARFGHTDTSDAPVQVTPVYARVNPEAPYAVTMYDTLHEWLEAVEQDARGEW